MIKEIDINGFSTELKNTKLDYPQSSNGNAFKLFFNYLGETVQGGLALHNFPYADLPAFIDPIKTN